MRDWIVVRSCCMVLGILISQNGVMFAKVGWCLRPFMISLIVTCSLSIPGYREADI